MRADPGNPHGENTAHDEFVITKYYNAALAQAAGPAAAQQTPPPCSLARSEAVGLKLHHQRCKPPAAGGAANASACIAPSRARGQGGRAAPCARRRAFPAHAPPDVSAHAFLM